VHMMGDVGKELPEDAELENLVDMDIPGLVAPGERSFDFVESEVREQLSHLPSQTRYYCGDSWDIRTYGFRNSRNASFSTAPPLGLRYYGNGGRPP